MDGVNKGNYRLNLLFVFFLVIYLACLIDLPSVPVSTFRLKVVYFVAPIFALIFFANGFGVNKKVASVGFYFLLLIFPSIIFSYNLLGSFAYFLGAIVTVIIMIVMANLSSRMGGHGVATGILYLFRFAIVVSVALVVFGVQERAHFSLYEPSYFSIALIPYFSLVLYSFMVERGRPYKDLALIIVAVVASQSASMIFWLALISIFFIFKSGRKGVFVFVAVVISFFVASMALYKYNERAASTINLVEEGASISRILIHVAGNRPQRVLVAVDVFEGNPFFGVGMNALKVYSGENLNAMDYEVDGWSAQDFQVSMNAVNSYLEIAAESGIFGVAGYLFVLFFVFTRRGGSGCFYALKVAFFVTCLALLIESSYLRSYVWALYGIVIGLSSYELRLMSRSQGNLS